MNKNKCNSLNNRNDDSNSNLNSSKIENNSIYTKNDITNNETDTSNKTAIEPYLRVRSSSNINDNSQNMNKVSGKRDGLVRDFAWSPCNVNGGTYMYMDNE
jgi:hypothetical protein